ncbi:MAG: methionyl-tRNA formyltransferase [Thiomargarita sp.]|nr:methionyl-tRNA formyltransferase [Thiomargarita sp.]
MKKRIVFAGTPEFAIPSLLALLNSTHKVCAVYTQPDRKAGRGRKLKSSPVKLAAIEHNIPIYQPNNLKNVEDIAQLQALNADLIVVVAYGLILPKNVLEIPHFGCVNVHASLLPRWRGAAPIQRALIAGDVTTGISLMQMDVGLDTGDMLKQVNCTILANDTGQTLHDRLASLGAQLLTENIDNIENLPTTKQDDKQAIYAKKLAKAEAKLDWQQPATILERKIRAFNPYPIAQAELFNQTFRIWEAKVLPISNSQHSVGSIISCQADGIDILTGENILRLLKIQTAGGKAITIKDFLNGHPEYLC